jgi:heme exporter protein D
MDWWDLWSNLLGVVLVILIVGGILDALRTRRKLLQQIADNTARIADALEKNDTRERRSSPDSKQGV